MENAFYDLIVRCMDTDSTVTYSEEEMKEEEIVVVVDIIEVEETVEEKVIAVEEFSRTTVVYCRTARDSKSSVFVW